SSPPAEETSARLAVRHVSGIDTLPHRASWLSQERPNYRGLRFGLRRTRDGRLRGDRKLTTDDLLSAIVSCLKAATQATGGALAERFIRLPGESLDRVLYGCPYCSSLNFFFDTEPSKPQSRSR